MGRGDGGAAAALVEEPLSKSCVGVFFVLRALAVAPGWSAPPAPLLWFKAAASAAGFTGAVEVCTDASLFFSVTSTLKELERLLFSRKDAPYAAATLSGSCPCRLGRFEGDISS